MHWKTLGLNRVGQRGLLWDVRAERRFALPDPRFGARFRMRFLISPGGVSIYAHVPSTNLRRPYQRGDVDGDQQMGIQDGIQILNQLFDHSAGVAESFCESAADANGDDIVVVTDTLRILQSLYLDGQDLSPPFYAPGYDESIDKDLTCAPYTENE